MFLRQSTAVVLSFGPFCSPTDGVALVVSLVSALDHASTGIKLSKNGGALTVRHATVTATTYDGYGNYRVTLDTTDTGTLGSLRVQFADATTNLPVWADFQVIPANVYDSLVLGSDTLDVSVTALADGTISEATIATPAEAAGRPTGLLAMLRRLFEWHANKRTRDRSTGIVSLRNAGDTGTLESQTQSTTGAADSQSQGA